ncbi:MAG TPA: hypothetical protein VIK55_11080 [Paludibacter sp.]
MPTIKKPAALACVYVNGEVRYRESWALAKTHEKQLQHLGHVEVHDARHYVGVDYCKKCGVGFRNPYLATYEKHDYWHCQDCHQINYIN